MKPALSTIVLSAFLLAMLLTGCRRFQWKYAPDPTPRAQAMTQNNH